MILEKEMNLEDVCAIKRMAKSIRKIRKECDTIQCNCCQYEWQDDIDDNYRCIDLMLAVCLYKKGYRKEEEEK